MLKSYLRSLFLLPIMVALLIASVGCGNSNGDSLVSNENVQNSKEHQQTDAEIGELYAKFRANDNEFVTFRAETYIQSPEMSWEYSLDVEVKADKIYINGVLYVESSSTPPIVLYSDGFLSYAASFGTEIANTLTKIKDCGSCFLLETEQDSKTGQIISVYEIDDFLYFVRFFDNGEVMRVHRTPVI